MVIVVFTPIAVVVAIPVMVVLDPAALTLPIPPIEALSIVTRSYPSSPPIGWASPISSMPPVMAPYGIPVPVYPDEVWTRPRRNGIHAWRRRRTNSDSNGNLAEKNSASEKRQSDQSGFHTSLAARQSPKRKL
jgi:hypothetical protein